MSIQTAIDNKNRYIDKLVNRFDGNFEIFSKRILKDLESLFKGDDFNKEAIEQIFNKHGFTEMIEDFINTYPTLFSHAKKVSKEIGG